MAKVPFSKLQAAIDGQVTQINYKDKSGKEVCYEVKHYLPFKDKLDMITKIINQSIDDNGFYNPMRVELYTTLEVVYAYTNLSFTEKQKEDPFKLYDVLVSTGIFTNIIDCIRKKDWVEIQAGVWDTIKNIYDYRNSVMGILEKVKDDYSSLELNAANIQDQLSDPNNMELLRDVLAKLG